ncbi:MAG TPA: SMI1/KNR4 family protein [Polyangiaceae bacterium]|nr:SMI1/KNR4 family protein [Polyangiaceae bacterium]
MASFSSLLTRIKETQTEILRVAPFRDIALVPNPGASKRAIAAVEARIGHRLPPSYREFLALHDGWPRFFEGATLLGSANLGKRMYEDLARAVFEAAQTPVPHLAPPSRATQQPIVPFGIDLQGTTLFAFNPAVTRADGECEVIAWVNEIGVRRDSFSDFLEFVLEMCEAELDGYRAPAAARGRRLSA